MSKPLRVLYLTNVLSEYRIPILELMCKDVRLTVAHTGTPMWKSGHLFNEIILHSYKIGPFNFIKEDLFPIACDNDVLLILGEIKCISFTRLVFRKNRPYKVCFWGIGVSASYSKRFDEVKRWDKIRFFIMRQAESLVFYSDYPIKKYVEAGINESRLFVAHNTVEVKYNPVGTTRDILLFVGTMYKQKNIFSLLENYKNAMQKVDKMPELHLIGGGDGLSDVRKWIEDQHLNNMIFTHGPIYDETTLAKYHQKSIASISPGQAGLSVLKSMGYGSPFITMNNSITGGERSNILNEHNGILYDKESELESILIDIVNNKEKYLKMGKLAKEYYDNFRTPQIMVDGLLNAIKYCIK